MLDMPSTGRFQNIGLLTPPMVKPFRLTYLAWGGGGGGILKSMKKIAVTDKKYSMSVRPFTVKNYSHADMRTSHAQLSEKSCQHGQDDSKNKILS